MCKKSLAKYKDLEAHINKLGPVKRMRGMAAERGTISFHFKCLRRVALQQC